MSSAPAEIGPMLPTIGRIVIYRSKTGDYVMPAIITATTETLYRPNVEAGHVPDLSSDMHVHLVVFTAGMPGHVALTTAENHPELADPSRRNHPYGGTYQEWDIPWNADASAAGAWSWPIRV